MSRLRPPPRHVVDGVLGTALEEDLGGVGDVTTSAVIPEDSMTTGDVVARGEGVIAGLDIALRTFELVGGPVAVEAVVDDGQTVHAGSIVASLNGSTWAILTGERTCLNILGHLSGIATATAQMVAAVAHTNARIVDTRKTTPGLRAVEKYAVRVGGAANHRYGLHDAVLIKDNHLAVAGDLAKAITMARSRVGHMVKVEVEVETMEQLVAAVEAGVDAVLLDNMTTAQLEAAVAFVDGRCVTEASGGITAGTVAAVAETGVDLISVGWITHSARRLDLALDLHRS